MDFFVTYTGIRFTKGKLCIEENCRFSSDATVETEGITFGDGVTADNDSFIIFLPESTLQLESGFMNFDNVVA